MIEQHYAEDTGWAPNKVDTLKALKVEAPKPSKLKNMQVNETKTEEYVCNQ